MYSLCLASEVGQVWRRRVSDIPIHKASRTQVDMERIFEAILGKGTGDSITLNQDNQPRSLCFSWLCIHPACRLHKNFQGHLSWRESYWRCKKGSTILRRQHYEDQKTGEQRMTICRFCLHAIPWEPELHHTCTSLVILNEKLFMYYCQFYVWNVCMIGLYCMCLQHAFTNQKLSHVWVFFLDKRSREPTTFRED